jgi:hypothetical protein
VKTAVQIAVVRERLREAAVVGPPQFHDMIAE